MNKPLCQRVRLTPGFVSVHSQLPPQHGCSDVHRKLCRLHSQLHYPLPLLNHTPPLPYKSWVGNELTSHSRLSFLKISSFSNFALWLDTTLGIVNLVFGLQFTTQRACFDCSHASVNNFIHSNYTTINVTGRSNSRLFSLAGRHQLRESSEGAAQTISSI